jgi:short-subunit dehydrogenase
MPTYHRALITGASSGIGRAFAAELPARTDLLLTGRHRDRLEQTATGLRRPGRAVETHVADLSDEAAIHALSKRAEAFEVDLLINNAGRGQFGRIADNDLQEERNTVLVNVLAVVILTRRAGIVIVSSTAAFAPVPFFATYAATKAFELSFSEALREEMRALPVDVLALCPGATRTAFGARAGLAGGQLPGASDPAKVAREGLRALGRVPVKITGTLDQAALGPLLMPRRMVVEAMGMAMRLLNACGVANFSTTGPGDSREFE